MLLRYMVIITKTKDRKCYKWPPIGKQNQEYSGVIYAQNINHLIQNNYGSKLWVSWGDRRFEIACSTTDNFNMLQLFHYFSILVGMWTSQVLFLNWHSSVKSTLNENPIGTRKYTIPAPLKHVRWHKEMMTGVQKCGNKVFAPKPHIYLIITGFA